jgi:peptidoglycan/xylan/chitin deacetylase (PgdA/CDA1 family)
MAASLPAALRASAPDRTVVLTLDDAPKSHRTFVAPLLKELGFGATFFITHSFMRDAANFMTWNEVADLHRMGFEIGNHSWTHADFSSPRNACATRWRTGPGRERAQRGQSAEAGQLRIQRQ